MARLFRCASPDLRTEINLHRIIRAEAILDISRDGRSDAIYGDMHFYLPAGTAVYQDEPGLMEKSPRNTPVNIPLPLYITRHLKQGNLTVLTRTETAPDSGEFNTVGDPLVRRYRARFLSALSSRTQRQKSRMMFQFPDCWQ